MELLGEQSARVKTFIHYVFIMVCATNNIIPENEGITS